MTTNVVRAALLAFNRTILRKLKLKGEEFDVNGLHGELLRNPCQSRRTPIILVPLDILRKLPIARDWDEVADAAYKNSALRARVNEHVAHIWAAKTKRDKAKLRSQALADRKAFETLLDTLHEVPLRAYDASADPDGVLSWAQRARSYAARFPLHLVAASPLTLDNAHLLVRSIVARFRQLIEHNGLNRELYRDDETPRHESTAQRIFFAVAYCYCDANDLDISPEVDTGSGKIDFKFSQGFDRRVLVEVKLSTNSSLVQGYETQLETYKAAQQTLRAIYLVLDVGRMGKKDEKLVKVRNSAAMNHQPLSDLEFVDGRIKPTASKRATVRGY